MNLVMAIQKLQIIEKEIINLKKKYESLEATIETLSDPEMKQIEKSLKDIRAGRTRNIEELMKEV
ncbi:MAG: CopG family transcriptional regulator [Candidatus Aenigmatarchaeota archaeon]